MGNLVLAFMDTCSIEAYVIRLLTWSNYSHVGIVAGPALIESRRRDGGVIENALYTRMADTAKTLFREYATDGGPIIAAARAQIGKPYDLRAVLGLPFHRDWQEDNKWFCSELVAWAANRAETPLVIKKVGRITPQDLLQVPFLREWHAN